MEPNWKGEERKIIRELEKISGKRKKGEQLNMGTGSEIPTSRSLVTALCANNTKRTKYVNISYFVWLNF